MHAEKHERWIATEADLQHLEDVREKVKDVDLTTPEGAEYARDLLREYGLPQFLVFGLKHVPTSEAGMRWAEQRLQEMRDSGELS